MTTKPKGKKSPESDLDELRAAVAEKCGGRVILDGVAPEECYAIDLPADHPDNPNEGDVGAVLESVRAHGIFRRIVVQRATPKGEPRMRIIAGHHTRRAAREAGYTHLPMEFVVCTDRQARKILLVDNRTTRLGHDNKDALATLLQELAAADDGLTGTGYDGDDLDALLAELNGTPRAVREEADDVDLTPPAEPRTRPGDVYVLGDHRLVCGSSLEPAVWERLMDGRKADLVWTDPPYGVAYVGKTKDSLTIQNDRLDPGALQQFLRDALALAWAHCREGGGVVRSSALRPAVPAVRHRVVGAEGLAADTALGKGRVCARTIGLSLPVREHFRRGEGCRGT